MKSHLPVLLSLLLIGALVLIATCCLNYYESEKMDQQTEPSRFVQVDESLICSEYHLGTDAYLSDGTKTLDGCEYRYVVDRVSRRVYIEIRDRGSHNSGILWIECLDKDGNHMVYTGELEGK